MFWPRVLLTTYCLLLASTTGNCVGMTPAFFVQSGAVISLKKGKCICALINTRFSVVAQKLMPLKNFHFYSVATPCF